MLQRLRQARKDAGYTQAEVARIFGKYSSFVSKIEIGERRLDPMELQDLARLYGKPVSDFL